MLAIIHTCDGTRGDRPVLITVDHPREAAKYADVLNRLATTGQWVAVPPPGSGWEDADWDTLARRSGMTY